MPYFPWGTQTGKAACILVLYVSLVVTSCINIPARDTSTNTESEITVEGEMPEVGDDIAGGDIPLTDNTVIPNETPLAPDNTALVTDEPDSGADPEITDDADIAEGESEPDTDEIAAADDPPDGETETPETPPLDPELAYLDMEIRTSSLTELAAWLRELGLSDGGGIEELASRLRSHYGIPFTVKVESTDRLITVESATTTEFFTVESVDEEYARLSGGVVLSLRDGDALHRISAGEILYNRTRNVLTASGSVEYIRETGDTIETFRGESITVNLDNWSGFFVDGASERSSAGSVSAYRFAGTVISRDSEGSTVLSQAEISNPANEDALWSIYASKLWLLPGNDFAILNSVLRVGHVPVFYIPFFYFPADQLIFHPVIGTKTREGTFLQTTTYILGRPKAVSTSESSITSLFQSDSSNIETKREGVFLRSTGQRRRDEQEIQLSLLADAYTNLGSYVGTDFSLPGSGRRGAITLFAGIGMTRNIYPAGDGFTPFRNYDGESEWNKGRFFSYDVPVRYRFRTTGSHQVWRGSINWDIPMYSDSYIERDFFPREESMDWISMLTSNFSPTEETFTTDSSMGSYEWRISGNITFPVTAVSPYINTLSISSLSSSLRFNSRASPSYDGPLTPANPGRNFFFPHSFTLYSVSASMGGTPLTLGGANRNTGSDTSGNEDEAAKLFPDTPISPWETEDAETATGTIPLDPHVLLPPTLGQSFQLRTFGSGTNFTIGYRVTPNTAAEMQFRSTQDNWKDQEDIDWSEISTVLSSFRSNGDLTFDLTHAEGGAYSSGIRLSGTGSLWNYFFLNEEAEEFTDANGEPDPDRIEAAQRRLQRETRFTSAWDYNVSVRPFFQSVIWGNSSVRYDVGGHLSSNTFDDEIEGRKWEHTKWNPSDLSTHQVTTSFAANVLDNNQTLTLRSSLPRQGAATASANASFRVWISTTSISHEIYEPWDTEKRDFKEVQFSQSFAFTNNINFQQTARLDPKERQYTSLTSTLRLWNLRTNFIVTYIEPWRFNELYGTPGGGTLWQRQPDKSLEPQRLEFSYQQTFARNSLWNNRLAFSFNAGSTMAFDLQQYTNSRLGFNLGISTRIVKFMDFSLSTSSENAVLYRYFQNSPFFRAPPVPLYSGYETNFFLDLLNSFRFDNADLRRQSGFKLRSINTTLIHYLGDWEARLTVQTNPLFDAPSRSFKFYNTISFSIQWRPIEIIKSTMRYEQEKLTIE